MASGWGERFAETRYRFMRVSRATGDETEVIRCLKGGSITRNDDTRIKESAEASLVESYDFGPDLVRVHMSVRTVSGATMDAALGTFLPVVPSVDISGARHTHSLKMYGRLQELLDDKFSRPYTVEPGSDAVAVAAKICTDAGLEVIAEGSDYRTTNVRYYGVGASQSNSETDDSKLGAVNDLLDLAGFRSAHTDAMGRVVLERYRDPADIQTSWDFSEGPSARFEMDMSEEYDYTSAANHVVVRYGGDGDTEAIVAEAWDTDPNSPLSTVSRGRTITRAYSYTDLPEGKTDADRRDYASKRAATLLKTAQSVIRRVTMTTAYTPTGINDTVNIEYPTGGVSGKFQIRTQRLSLLGGCPTEVECRQFRRRS